MKKLVLLLTMVLAYQSYSQNCKYEKDEVDDFTKKSIKITKPEILTITGMGYGFSTSYAFAVIDGNKYLKFNISSPSLVSLKIGDKLLLKTNSENLIELEFTDNVVGEYRPGANTSTVSTQGVHSLTTLIPLSENNFERLISEDIIKIRVQTNQGDVDEEVKSKRASKVKQLANCIK